MQNHMILARSSAQSKYLHLYTDLDLLTPDVKFKMSTEEIMFAMFMLDESKLPFTIQYYTWKSSNYSILNLN